MRYLALSLCLLLCALIHAQTITYDKWENITTGGSLPQQCKIQHSNNNLDLVKYKKKYYLAFRTAPTHFASSKTVMYVVSSTDLKQWQYETEVHVGYDIREPRFALYNDTLNLYFFEGGKKKFEFDPRYIWAMRTTGSGWSERVSIHLDGYVPWRLRVHNDTLLLSAYYGKGLYKKSHHSDLRLFQSIDGLHFTPISKDPQIDVLSAEEGEFIFDKKGDMYATVRLEGTGALVCKADKGKLQTWNYKRTKYKYDSALLFDHEDDIYLIARRNIDGEMDKVKHRKNEKQGKMRNLIRYSITKKVTALYKLDKDSLTVTPLMDFPSTGDCSYAGIAQIDKDSYLVMNYSSDINKSKRIWINGQLGKTYIYSTVLHFGK